MSMMGLSGLVDSVDGGGNEEGEGVQWLAKLRGGQLVQKGRFLVCD